MWKAASSAMSSAVSAVDCGVDRSVGSGGIPSSKVDCRFTAAAATAEIYNIEASAVAVTTAATNKTRASSSAVAYRYD
ncbi:hypothetical protein PoB_005271000 [Plakobranchus ocellatus]|uniref:Secreted protein n=1 Tax=Plakobranchus ocellatus TaxID=259542 RepID=A0AAV4C498_9GAST|nr:hypothetical protein PoB_005271000 [Plakobranchus ocellatus]